MKTRFARLGPVFWLVVACGGAPKTVQHASAAGRATGPVIGFRGGSFTIDGKPVAEPELLPRLERRRGEDLSASIPAVIVIDPGTDVRVTFGLIRTTWNARFVLQDLRVPGSEVTASVSLSPEEPADPHLVVSTDSEVVQITVERGAERFRGGAGTLRAEQVPAKPASTLGDRLGVALGAICAENHAACETEVVVRWPFEIGSVVAALSAMKRALGNDSLYVRFPDALPAPPKPALSREEIDGVIRHAKEKFDACYRRALGRQSRVEGTVFVRFVIEPDGSVSSADNTDKTTLLDEDAIQCMVEQYRVLRFPQSPRPATVVYPLRFVAPPPLPPADFNADD